MAQAEKPVRRHSALGWRRPENCALQRHLYASAHLDPLTCVSTQTPLERREILKNQVL